MVLNFILTVPHQFIYFVFWPSFVRHEQARRTICDPVALASSWRHQKIRTRYHSYWPDLQLHQPYNLWWTACHDSLTSQISLTPKTDGPLAPKRPSENALNRGYATHVTTQSPLVTFDSLSLWISSNDQRRLSYAAFSSQYHVKIPPRQAKSPVITPTSNPQV